MIVGRGNKSRDKGTIEFAIISRAFERRVGWEGPVKRKREKEWEGSGRGGKDCEEEGGRRRRGVGKRDRERWTGRGIGGVRDEK